MEPIPQGVVQHFGPIAPGIATGLKLRHDHGSNDLSGDFQDEITCLGITSSPSFVPEPKGNGIAERFIRTLCALLQFAGHDDEPWLVARHGHRTPAQVRADQRRVNRGSIDHPRPSSPWPLE